MIHKGFIIISYFPHFIKHFASNDIYSIYLLILNKIICLVWASASEVPSMTGRIILYMKSPSNEPKVLP